MLMKNTLFIILSMMTSAVVLAAAPSALDKAAFDAYNSHNYLAAFKEWSAAAAQGDAKAQYRLGLLYASGNGVPQDDVKAIDWLTKAAQQGEVSAQELLGIAYNDGHGVPQNYSKAADWWTKAAQQGNAYAQYNLGLLFNAGRGVPQNYAKAAEWWTKAAQQGDAKAQSLLGVLYLRGQGVPQDDTIAAEWVTKAAEQGFAQAQLVLGAFYDNGKGVEHSNIEAYKWYLLAKTNAVNNNYVYTEASNDLTQITRMMTQDEVSQAEQKASDWVKARSERAYKLHQENSYSSVPTTTSQSVSASSESEVNSTRQIISPNIDYYLKQVLGPNGHLDKALHEQFWQQFKGQPKNEVDATIKWLRGTLLVGQEFESELWKSALISYKSRSVEKTKRFVQLETDMPSIDRNSLPWSPGSSEYTAALAGFNSSWAISHEDANRLLVAAANHKPLVGVNGAVRQIDERTIEQALSSVNASFTRLSNLFDKNWNGD